MALNKDILGQALYDNEAQFNDVDIAPEDMEAARLNFWTVQAETIISHFKNSGLVRVSVTTAGTASAQSGSGTGTIE